MSHPEPETPFPDRVEQLLRGSLLFPKDAPAGERLLSRAASHLVLSPGAKRVRPLFMARVGAALGAAPAPLAEAAAAAELIHSASLLHDDVVDESALRRGAASANAIFGNSVAVLAGDYVLSQALRLLWRYPQALTVYAVETVAQMTEGAVAEVEARGRADLSVEAWRWIAERKCGVLFGWTGKAAALAAGRPDRAEPLARLGRALGVAFQMADDLKDLVDGEAGKPPFADLENRNPSFALSWAAAQGPFRPRLAALWGKEMVESAEAEALGQEIAAGCLEPLLAALDAELDGVRHLAGAALAGGDFPLEEVFEAIWGRLPRRRGA